MNDFIPTCGLMAIVTLVALVGKWVGKASYYAELQRRLDERVLEHKNHGGQSNA